MTLPFNLRLAALPLLALAMLINTTPIRASEEPVPRILVSGEGTAEVAPDMAVLQLTVTREAKTAREALDANSAAMSKVIAAMRSAGIDKRDLQTANFSIQPRYHHPRPQAGGEREAPQIVAYLVRNSLTVRVRDLGNVGEILDKSVSLGVNEGGRITFTNADPSAVINQARVAAVRDALSRAETLADAADVDLGEVLEISEQSFVPGPMPVARAEMAMASAADAVPIATGENSYRVTVHMSFAID
jgi:uncharacterized protein YggE